ncbi:hypothetical protein Lal_00040667 [Lupinus albus]|uniref:Putative aminoacyltransferase, E1 ubiquitin-activating enzyme n=1 Tax=Lupinus albus TaxID=3870 RepID=A0A6A5NUD1_LUPAL|nr:putative aminoacyltransferase, E1 ubiquitin-activating enzyme [Lupinus albus]KAF1887613.1 hypothetical protein Lal_00040667 [Lupinus albus]
MEKRETFVPFDIVEDASDHYFMNRNNNGERCLSNYKSSGVYKAIMKEWKILEQNLPESIYVRVYESRFDLMRAVIVGAEDTPYHDGLFFFDIEFPSDYPNVPPKLYYHSLGFRINPNLYNNGTVCLSLLNTWHGSRSEKWDPTGSTILQLLLSIQGLVLNQRPFFNEPGNNLFSIALHNKSRAYTCEVFSLTCRSSIHLLRNPPKHFESFVVEHFRRRGLAVLMACNEYVNGRIVGYLNENGLKVSKEFKNDLKALYPLLLQGLRRCNASLGTVAETLQLESVNGEKKISGIFKRALAKIKKVLGLKNRGQKKVSGIEG